MNDLNKTKINLKTIFLTAFIICTTFINHLLAQENKSAIVLYSNNIEISYHQPFRNTYKSNHPSYIEVPKLNQLMNLCQNYIQYLKKLNRLKGNPNIKISYSPDSVLEDNTQPSRIIKINDLGVNSLLGQINQYLAAYDFAEKKDLIENQESLYSIQDIDITKPNSFTKSDYFQNLSLKIPSNEPDTSYCIVNDENIITTRTSRKTNLIYKLSLNKTKNNSEVVSKEEADIWYQKMAPSNDGKFLALTDGLKPIIIDLNTKEKKELFPNTFGITLLDHVWSPIQNLLAGMILNENTMDRHAFIYDAERAIMVDFGSFSKKFEANYLNATAFWAANGKKLAYISAKSIHLIDLESNAAKANLLTIEGEIGEFMWSSDAESFAFVEVKGQTRSQYHFDDYDFRGSVLHRYRFEKDRVLEDYAQRIESRNTIKMVSFTEEDKIMYLEGKLVAPDTPGAVWDLCKTFNAYLTPPTSSNLSKKDGFSSEKLKPQHLPMQYLYVHRSLDSKNANIYDSGRGHSNLLYTDNFYSNWFIGLYRQSGIDCKSCVYSLRASPYPFQGNNYTYFLSESQSNVRLLLKFLQDYNIRLIDSDCSLSRLFMHSNFSGILNVWVTTREDLFYWLSNGDKPRIDANRQKESNEPEDEIETDEEILIEDDSEDNLD